MQSIQVIELYERWSTRACGRANDLQFTSLVQLACMTVYDSGWDGCWETLEGRRKDFYANAFIFHDL